MKLSVLPELMKIYRCAKMVGDYDFTKSVLYTEKLVGNITASLGFIRSNDNYYIPNTSLKEDIRNITVKPQSRMLAIFKKTIDEVNYKEVCYIAKSIDLENILLTKSFKDKVDLNFIKAKSE